jgi:hypothetical protein
VGVALLNGHSLSTNNRRKISFSLVSLPLLLTIPPSFIITEKHHQKSIRVG